MVCSIHRLSRKIRYQDHLFNFALIGISDWKRRLDHHLGLLGGKDMIVSRWVEAGLSR